MTDENYDEDWMDGIKKRSDTFLLHAIDLGMPLFDDVCGVIRTQSQGQMNWAQEQRLIAEEKRRLSEKREAPLFADG